MPVASSPFITTLGGRYYHSSHCTEGDTEAELPKSTLIKCSWISKEGVEGGHEMRVGR